MICFLCKKPFIPPLNFSSLFNVQLLKCNNCIQTLEKVEQGCPNCGKRDEETLCDDCNYWETKGLSIPNKSLFYYNDFSKSLIEQIKYYGDLKVIRGFRNDLLQTVRQHFRNSSTITIPVPMHPDKLKKRGFNQAEKIADLLPFKQFNCFRKQVNITQSKRSRRERLASTNDFIIDNPELVMPYINRKVIIVDDIYTTGSTVHQLAHQLIQIGFKKIESLTLFRS